MPSRLFAAALAALALSSAVPVGAQAPVAVTGVVTTREDGLPLPGAALEGKISDFMTTGTAPEFGNMVPMSM